MNLYDLGPISATLHAAYVGVTAIADALQPVAGTLAAASAIIILTLLVRAALIPVGASQVRAEFTRRRLAPQLAELQRRYKKNPELLTQKTADLYRRENASPFAGLLPALAQAPVLAIVYGLFVQPIIAGEPNALLEHDVFGASLGSTVFASSWPGIIVYLVLLGSIAGIAVLGRRANQRFALPASTPQAQRVADVLSWMPLITVVFAAFVPLAATIYLTVTTAWTVVERAVLRSRLDPHRSTGSAAATA